MFNKKFKQVTLTGFVVKKDPFIKNPVSLYDDFCNANFTQWTKDRKSFQAHVNSLWAKWKDKTEEEIKEYMIKLDPSKNVGPIDIARRFVIRKDGDGLGGTKTKPIETIDIDSQEDEMVEIEGGSNQEVLSYNSMCEAQVTSDLWKLRGLNYLCKRFGIKKEALISPDILQQDTLVRKIANLGVHLEYFDEENAAWSQRGLHWEKSKIKDSVENSIKLIETLRQKLGEISSPDLALDPRKSLMESEARKVQQKVDLIKGFIVESTKYLPIIEITTQNLKELNTKVLSRHIKYSPLEGRTFFGINGLELSWNEAIAKVRDYDNWEQVLITKEEVVKVAQQLSETNCQETKVLLKTAGLSPDIVEIKRNQNTIATLLTKFLPVIHVFSSKEKKSVLINVHELVLGLGHDTLADLLIINKEEDKDDSEPASEDIEDDIELVNQLNNKPGRKPYHILHPGLPQVVLDFVTQQGSQAQGRRRFEQSISGSTLKEIRDHVKTVFPALAKISRNTIHTLFYPPREGTKNASSYKKLLAIRVPKKSNDVRKINSAAHFLHAQSGYIGEFSSEFESKISNYSADDMNKLMIGPPAVSRYHQIKKFFPIESSPDYADHDFPTAKDYKLSVTGYMELKSVASGNNRKRRSYSEERISNSHASRVRFGSQDRLYESREDIRSQYKDTRYTVDKHGRKHLRKKLVGPVQQFIRPAKENVNASTHKFEMEGLLSKASQEGKVGAVFNVDGGPGYSVKHLPNFIEYADLFISSRMGFIIIHDCGAGLSAYNPIEAFWSFNTKQLTSVIFSDCVPGEEKAPALQSDLSEIQVEAKEKIVFDNAGYECEELLKNKVYAGHIIKAEYEPYLGQKEKRNVERYEAVHSFSDSTLNQVKEGYHKQMFKLYRFACKHSYRLRNVIYIVACKDKDCQACASLPNSIKDAEPLKILQEMGGRLFSPEKSTAFPESYMTYLELREKYKKDPSKIPEGDADYPDAEDLGVCKKGGCLGYHYNTKADQDRHIKLAHGGKVKFRNIDQNEAVEGPPRKKSFLCPFKDCQLNFPSEWKLRKHRDESGHRMAGTKGGRPQKKK